MPVKIIRGTDNIQFTCESCDYEESHASIHIAEEKHGWRCLPTDPNAEVTKCFCEECVSERMIEAVHKKYGDREDLSYQELVEAQEEWYIDDPES